MIKKVFALVMVVSVLGGLLAGCGAPAEETPATPPATDAPKTE